MRENSDLHEIASAMVSSGKGILAADESTSTMDEKRLASIDLPGNPENRRKFRQILFTAPQIEQYISGVIMYDASIKKTTDEGIPFADLLTARGIIPGIKVDKGVRPFQEFPGEMVTQGLDDLDKRLEVYYRLGARFAKWRAVINIGDGLPTNECLSVNAVMLARYAALCQEVGIVPMVEPEVIFDGAHDIARAEEVTTQTLQTLFNTLTQYRVDLKGVILKSSMVLAGKEYEKQSTPEEVAEATVRTFQNSVPHEVPGIVFLSGGQDALRATENLQAVAKVQAKRDTQSWAITFSYSRALEEPVLEAWQGKEENISAAQATLLHRAKMNSLAQKGEYAKEVEGHSPRG